MPLPDSFLARNGVCSRYMAKTEVPTLCQWPYLTWLSFHDIVWTSRSSCSCYHRPICITEIQRSNCAGRLLCYVCFGADMCHSGEILSRLEFLTGRNFQFSVTLKDLIQRIFRLWTYCTVESYKQHCRKAMFTAFI